MVLRMHREDSSERQILQLVQSSVEHSEVTAAQAAGTAAALSHQESRVKFSSDSF